MELVKRKGNLNQRIEWELGKTCDDCLDAMSPLTHSLNRWMNGIFGRRTEREYYGYVVRCCPGGNVFYHEADQLADYMKTVSAKDEQSRHYVQEQRILLVHKRIDHAEIEEGDWLTLYNAIRRGVLDPVKQKVARLGNEYLKFIDFNNNIRDYMVVERLGDGDAESIKCYKYLMKYLTLIPTVEIPLIPEPGECPHKDLPGVINYIKYCNNFINTYQWAIYHSRMLAFHALIKRVNSATSALPANEYIGDTKSPAERIIQTERFRIYRGALMVRGALDKKKNEYNWVNPLSKKYAIKNAVMNLDELYGTTKALFTKLNFQNDDTERIDLLYTMIKSVDQPEVEEDELGDETPEGDVENNENGNS